MKTTVELPDDLLARMRDLAARRGTSFKSLLEAAVRQFLGERVPPPTARFRLEDRSVAGRGLVKDLRGARWASIAQRAYAGRGG